MDLKNKVVLITGSRRGIGAAMAVAFAQEGAKLILNGRSPSFPISLSKNLAAYKTQVKYLRADLTKTDLKEFSQKAWAIFGQVDVLVNNAGLNRDKLFIGMRRADFDQVMDLDLRVPFFLSKEIIKKMNRKRRGVIINLASVVGLHGNIGQTNYAAAKAGLIGLTKAIAKEAALRRIRVNAIAPGMIDTDMTRALSPQVKKNILKQIPLGRLGKASEVAQTAIFIAENDYLTGQTLIVDGGMTM